MFAGGVVRWLVERRMRSSERSIAEVESGPGVLFSSGLIAGGAIAGIAIAGIAAALVSRADAAQVPAADYLAHVAGLQQRAGRVRAERPRRRSWSSPAWASCSTGWPAAEDAAERTRLTGDQRPDHSRALVLGRAARSGCRLVRRAADRVTRCRHLPDRRVLYVGLFLVSAAAVRRRDVHGRPAAAALAGPSQDDWWQSQSGQGHRGLGVGRGPALLWAPSPTCSRATFARCLRTFTGLLLFGNYRPSRLIER